MQSDAGRLELRRKKQAAYARAYRKLNREAINQRRRSIYADNAEKERERLRLSHIRNRDKRLADKRVRYAANPEADRARSRGWATANPDKVREKRRAWRLNNPEKVRLKKQRYHKSHKGEIASKRAARTAQIRVARSAWVEKNREHVRRKNSARHARKMGASGYHTATEFRTLCEAREWRCAYCKCQLDTKSVTEDHRIPLSRGGSDSIDNIAPCCAQCNSSKGPRTDLEFAADGGRRVAA